MNQLRKSAVVLMATVGLAACGSNRDSSQNAAGPAGADMNATTAASSDPFADAERKMNDAMMAAVGSDAGDSWAKKMIAHHQGAVDMSEVVLQQNPKPDVAQMARDGIKKQQMDIADIQKLVKNGAPDQKSADLYRQAMMDMQQKMQAATGADASETFMRKMLEHHKGAVAMSDIALKNGVSGALRAQVQKTRSENQKDAEMVQAMLDGKPMQHAMMDSGASTAGEMAAGSKPAERAAKTTDGHKAHDMDNMGNMDMNNM